MSDLETRVAKLEAVEAIRALKLEYARYCDTGYPHEKIAALFTETAVWDGGEQFGVHRGRDAIRDYFSTIGDKLTFAMHYMIGDTITVGDDLVTARGSWCLWEAATQVNEGPATSTWIMGWYDDEYVLEDGTWKFANVTVDFCANADAAKGWHEDRYNA